MGKCLTYAAAISLQKYDSRHPFYDKKEGYPLLMRIEVVQSEYHSNGRAAPFYAALVDDPDSGDTKLVIMFDEPDYTAVFSLDSLLEDEDISSEKHRSRGDIFDDLLRDTLWYPEEDG